MKLICKHCGTNEYCKAGFSKGDHSEVGGVHVTM